MRKPMLRVSHRTTKAAASSKRERVVKIDKRDRVTVKPTRASTK